MQEHLEQLISQTLNSLNVTDDQWHDILSSLKFKVEPSKDRSHGDFATNVAFPLAKQLKRKPQDIALLIQQAIPEDPVIAKTEVAGAGFINFFIDRQWIAHELDAMFTDEHLGVPLAQQKQTIVVDYSAPNVAKEMAVHHLRSTVIGDAVVRVLEFIGHNVIRANHIGDWGTQFGMLIAYLEKQQTEGSDLELSDFEAFYREAKSLYDRDPQFAETSRSYVVKLQSGDAHCHELWQKLVKLTMDQNMELYRRLDVTLTDKDTMGESLYNDMLPGVIEDLRKKNIAVESDGALVVYLPEFKNKEGGILGNIVRKKDGGYLYTTTDIACVKYRIDKLKADRILYFTDSRQSQHHKTVWAIAKLAGYVPERIALEHCPFGMMLGKDGKPFKTRSGGTVKLRDLLDEAENRVKKLLAERGSTLSAEEQQEVVHNVAVGAVKYADLSKNRTTDYVFDWDNILSFSGNTAPYLQYAYSRIRAIETKAAEKFAPGAIILQTEAEDMLASKLRGFSAAVNAVADKALPNILCSYLYDLAESFMVFYEKCPVLKNDTDELVRASRLQLCGLTGKVLRCGLGLLGIKVMDRM